VVLSSTFVSRGETQPDQMTYARADSPSYAAAEELIGLLERGPLPATVLASGMAAVDAAFSLVPVGGRVVMPEHGYSTARSLAVNLAKEGRIRLTMADIANTAAVTEALAGDGEPAAMCYIETPTNPMLEVADGPALVKAAHEVGAVVAVDNTLATPLVQRPLDWGADVVIHSMTKYMGGHSDLLMGAVVARSKEHHKAVRRYRELHGAVPGAFDCFLALRGMRTLALRMQRINESAATLARRLDAHAAVDKVRHPSLPSDPGHELAKTFMAAFGGVISIEMRGGLAAAEQLMESVRLWAPATSLGGVESTLERRGRYPNESPDVPPNLVRLSVGIENVDDLWDDLSGALTRSGG